MDFYNERLVNLVASGNIYLFDILASKGAISNIETKYRTSSLALNNPVRQFSAMIE